MTIRRIQQITDLLEDQFYDEFDFELEKPLLEASRIVGQELTDQVTTDRLPFEVLAIYPELISLYLNASLMTCLKATREVAALTRPMIEGAIVLSKLFKDKDGSFLEDLEANRINSFRLLDNAHIQYDVTTPGQIAFMKFDRRSMEDSVREGLDRIRQGESPLSKHVKITARVEDFKDGQYYWLYILCSNYLHFIEYGGQESMSEKIHHFARVLLANIVEDCAAMLDVNIEKEMKEFRAALFEQYKSTNYGLNLVDFSEIVWTLSDIFKEQNVHTGMLSSSKYKLKMFFPGNLSVLIVGEQGPAHLINQSVLEPIWNKLKSGKLRVEDVGSDMTSRDIIATAFSALPYVEILGEDRSQFLVADGEKAFLFNLSMKVEKVVIEKITALFEKGIFPMKCGSGCDNESNDFRVQNYRGGYIICPICKSEKLVDFDELLRDD